MCLTVTNKLIFQHNGMEGIKKNDKFAEQILLVS